MLRLRPGDALSLTITVGEGGRATFSAEVEGGGTVTATGTAANLDAGEYQVRSDGATMTISDPGGTVVPRTTRFDIGWSRANDALLRALAGATTNIPMHVTAGSVTSGGGEGGEGGAVDPDSVEGRRQRLAALPEHVRNFLFTPGSGQEARPEDLATLLRIAESVADMSDVELAEYRARTTGGTTDVADFEAGVNRWLGEVRARRGAEAEQEQATMALLGMDAVYELYRSWQVGLLMGDPPSWIYEWEALPTSALPADRAGTMNQIYLALRRSLEPFGYPNLAAFVTAINRFTTAFRETAVHVARDLLDRYEHTLLEQQARYAAGSAGLHAALAPARASYSQAYVHLRASAAPNVRESMTQDDMAMEEAAEYARLHAQGQSQVRAQAGAHPLLANPDFPVDELGRAEDDEAVTQVIRDYITERLGNVRDTRDRINDDHEIIYDLDILVTTTKARRGIRTGSLWDKIIQDHQAPTLAEIERNLMIMVLTVGLGVLTAGTGSLVLGAIAVGVSAAQAVQTYAEYAAQSDAYGAQLLSEEPSLVWVVLAIMAVAFDLAAVSTTIRPIRSALQTFQRTGDVAELNARLAGVEERIRRSILARAEVEARAHRGWQGLGLVPPGALRSSFGIELLAEQFGKLVYSVRINLQRGLTAFEQWRATQEAIDLVGDINQLTPAQLRQLGDMYTRAVADAQRVATHGRTLGMTTEEVDEALRLWAQRGTGTADDVMAEMTAARSGITPDGARPPTVEPTTPRPGETVEPTTPRTGETVEPTTPRPGETVEPATPRPGETVEPATPRTGETVEPTTPRTGEAGEEAAPRTGEAGEEAAPRTGETTEPPWTPPRSWNGPANHGRWDGVRGDSGWIDDRAEVIRVVGRGPGGEANPIPFRRGVVDFTPWSQGELTVAGLTGEHANDMKLIRLAIADRQGLAVGRSDSVRQAAALDWLRSADDGFGGTGLRPHHAGGSRIQLIPRDAHKVQHTDLAVYTTE